MKGFWLCTATNGCVEQAEHEVLLICKDWLMQCKRENNKPAGEDCPLLSLHHLGKKQV